MFSNVISEADVLKVAKLAHIKLSPEKIVIFAKQLEPILEYFAKLNQVNVEGVVPTYQVTGQKNILRQDFIDTKRMFTQAQSLSNAPQSKNGFFITKSISKK
ncbi:Asp-tRNA(Asn)/Glu-tRNA(Gln) amidotransferase GatCAB subunit C [Candidatus Peregrinibacteria bacterium CG11_big_fil_rev_8_21_14_0_20_46_8]|uniref:Aspartyl/glutamyl-tRNA(Asn/Gln) amidotransferase subunit C n=2 Tax=Candidatus Shapironibacteriota TaxID=1752721 RepID=A0A2M7TT53_9BACT|nr:MAG: Asp-tRNA(Asn)/Glu-tRNA(Gln) amidotransferase GatCAB subunit C [Candidatus Peregrinibacteria bacterium CG11_big_fil_rev_8_21_14_0_20_46_8]PIU73106.1 MAG: Asp-tRNA(Asn)/Glu-tRNA(Gln) amidotransferase GatCAB subunit C [Candidatus Shapirobacteria bacterium CG06_land_8_20_14_3_00_40_12]PIZ58983.1 MAG: Asp-tRNA(Asn)/Glu-tRNA(Gln) amidotransferase GatCAB subunit C [Candidatus Shapirobacteria bacterium CG_4_10_14_0_2_um_filter_40_12]